MNLRITITTLACCFFTCMVQGQNARQQEPTFPVDQLREDIAYLKKNLEARHPDLYLYTNKESLDKIFDSLTNAIHGPMSELDFYKHITILSSVIKDGHTIMLPAKRTMDYHNNNSRFIPYKFLIINNKLYVDMVYTNDSTILSGAEVLQINNMSSAQIIDELISRQVRDGNNLTYPYWIINNFFRSYYSFVFGHPEQFNIEYRQNEIVKTATINGVTNDSIYYYRKLKYPNRTNEKKPNEGITLQLLPDNKYAILTIKDFHDDILRKEYRQNFDEVISEYFQQLHDRQPNNLIIDIRDNQGGDIPNGATLLSYLLDKPFTIIQSYYEVDNSTTGFQLKKTNGQSLGIHKPKDNVYKGKLFVLINGGSFSNSGIVASCLKRNNRAIFIGEETGGNNKVLAGYIKNYSLPNTNIHIEIPTRQFLLDETLPLTGRGTVPDHIVQQALTNDDIIMQYAIEQILNDQ